MTGLDHEPGASVGVETSSAKLSLNYFFHRQSMRVPLLINLHQLGVQFIEAKKQVKSYMGM